MKRRGWMILAATVAVGLALLLGGVVAQPPTGTKTPPQPGKNELDPGNSLSSSNGLGTEQIQALGVPSELQDAAFERYVDLALLGRAWAEMDASLLADIGLQLAEGERVLFRPHKAISADSVLEFAIKAAAEKKDHATLDRLAKTVDRAGRKDLALKIETARKLASASRAGPGLVVDVDQVSPENFALYRETINRIRAARVAGDLAKLNEIEDGLEQLSALTKAQKEAITKLVAESRSGIPKEGAKTDPTVGALDKLAAASRQYSPRTVFAYEGGWVKQDNPPAGNTWTECQWNGNVFNFIYAGSNASFVQLYDASRVCTVRIYSNRLDAKFGAGTYDTYQWGRWVQ